MIFVHACESFKFGEYWGEIQGGKHAQGEGGYQGRVKQVRGDRGAVCVCAAFPHAVIGRTAMSHVRHSLSLFTLSLSSSSSSSSLSSPSLPESPSFYSSSSPSSSSSSSSTLSSSSSPDWRCGQECPY